MELEYLFEGIHRPGMHGAVDWAVSINQEERGHTTSHN